MEIKTFSDWMKLYTPKKEFDESVREKEDLLIRDVLAFSPSFVEDEITEEFGCSSPLSFKTSEGIKTMKPGKCYDRNLNEIKKGSIQASPK